MLSIYFVAFVTMVIGFQNYGLVVSVPLFEDNNSADISNQLDNSLDANAGIEFEPVRSKWVSITQKLPATVRRAPGAKVELECIASGRPAPIITWFRNKVPIAEDSEVENNALIEGTETSISKVHSRLIIYNFFPMEKVSYSCLARSGPKTAISSTVVQTTYDRSSRPASLNEFLLLNQEALVTPTKPRIVFFYELVLENTGSTLVLPCKVVSHPRADISWIANENETIDGNGPRFNIMKSGELVINELRWEDMGLYTCVAKNGLGNDTTNTFVYPTTN